MKGMFVRGELSPGLLAGGLQRPDEMRETLEWENPRVQEGIQEISKQLLRIKVSAEAVGGKIIVISLPNGFFVSKLMLANYARMGFTVEQSYLTATVMDEAVRLAGSKAGVDFFEVTGLFRQESMKRNLFYSFDGHYNSEGQHFFAQCIAPFITTKLRSMDR